MYLNVLLKFFAAWLFFFFFTFIYLYIRSEKVVVLAHFP